MPQQTQQQQQAQKGDKGTLPDGSPVTFDGVGWLRDDAIDSTQQEDPAQQSGGYLRTAGRAVKDFGVGIGKGAAGTLNMAGEAARDYIPGVGPASDALQKLMYGSVAAPNMMENFKKELEPTNTAQSIGAGAERVGEFLLPGSKIGMVGRLPSLGRSAVNFGARHIPSSIWGKASPLLKAAGSGADSAAIATLHGDENPDLEAALTAGGSLSGAAMGELAPLIAKQPILAKLLPIFLATSIGGAAGGPLGGTGGGLLAMFGAKRTIADQFIKWIATHPDEVRVALQGAGMTAGRAASGTVNATGKGGPASAALKGMIGP